eukprot:EG_transcript_21970
MQSPTASVAGALVPAEGPAGSPRPGSAPKPGATLLRRDPPVRAAEAPPFVSPKSPLRDGARKQTPPLQSVGVASRAAKWQAVPAEEVLQQLFPPRQWSEDGTDWLQCVSSSPATRMDIITLQEQLDLRCQQRHALPQGICPVREDLYEQAFDELIREVTVGCAEQGLLLARMRDEIRTTIEAYKVMYDTACQLSMRQVLQLEAKRSLAQQLRQLEEEKAVSERMLAELRAKHEAIEKREIERRQADEQRHKEEVAFLKKTNAQLTGEIKRYMG